MSILNVHDPLQVPGYPENPVVNGRLYVFALNSEVFVPLFEDSDLTTSTANPLEADHNGNFAPAYLVDGVYKLVLRSQTEKLIMVQQEVTVAHVTQNSAGQREFLTLPALLSDASLSYSTAQVYSRVVVGEILRVTDSNYGYEVADETATDHHEITAGGVKVYERYKFSSRSKFVDAVARGWIPPEGHSQTVAARQYMYVGASYLDGPDDLPGWQPEGIVTPEHFASDLSVDATYAVNAALQFSATFDRPGRSSGDYRLTGTIAPGGTYNWDWGNTQLLWVGSDVTTLTEVMFNPDGSTTPQPSGKYTLFDTKDCTSSVNTGLLNIRGISPGNMGMSNRAFIPDALIAITASENSSADMIWDGLSILGCGQGLWQGDQRGSAANILPYTRWSVRYLKIQFCLNAINGGSSGNAFDDGNWNNVRLTRNENNGTIRTDFVCNSIFLNGLNFEKDKEPQTLFTTAGSTTATLSVGSPYISEGDIICVEDANRDFGDTNSIPFVSRIAARNGTTLTLESAPERTLTNAVFVINPPSLLLSNASLVAQHVYAEECHDTPIRLHNQAVLDCQSLKLSDGLLGARYNTAVILTGLAETAVIANLHDRSIDNDELKAIVGVSNLVDPGVSFGDCLVDLTVRASRGAWSKSQPVRVIDLESDHLGTWQNNTGCLGEGYNVSLSCTDGRTQYMIGKVGTQEAYTVGQRGGFEAGSNLRNDDDMTGISRTGNCQAATGGTAVKVPGGVGNWYAPVPISAGERLRVDVTVDSFTSGTCTVALFDSAGGTPGTVTASFEHLAGTGRKVVFLDVPAGSTADRIGLQCASSAALTVSRFIVQKVLSV
ncbi:MAG: hypothetical protein ABJL99_11190 [Aliishimia sp.]